ncbi:MAG TPA: DUF1707 domain-containing protein [Marmoricola sp.]|jgi:hypothetical protein|nr:DUF1707 domain-containing protein [Marmoricola sp.]
MDEQRQPREADRRAVRDRITRAVADGRISSLDGDIRLGNVGSATTMTELGMIARDLDQLETVLPAGAAAPAAPVAPAAYPTPAAYPAPPTAGRVAAAARTGVRRFLPHIAIAAILFVIGGGGGLAVFGLHSGSDSSSSVPSVDIGSLPDFASDFPSDFPGDSPSDLPTGPSAQPAGGSYTLSAAGIRRFLATYRARFGTGQVVELTLYGDYVVVQVPAGKHQQTGWLYRDGAFTTFGGRTGVFPGSVPVSTAKLNVAALMRNLAIARGALGVPHGDGAYVNIDYRPEFDPAPNVNIYVTNKANQSGYLATEPSGRIERAYPYGS